MRRRARLFLVTAVGLVAAGAGAALFLEEGSFLFVAALELVLVLAFNAVLFVFIGRRTRIQRLLIETVLECESGGRRAQTGNGAAAPTGASSSSADHTTS